MAKYQHVIPTNDPIVKALRQQAHIAFDRIWQEGHMERNRAYWWLAGELDILRENAHMGRMLDPKMLRRVIDLSDTYIGASVAQDDFPDDLEE